MQKNHLSPSEIITVLNRSYRTTRESSSRDTVEAAQKAFNNCHNWLKARGIPFHQASNGQWVLDEKKTEQDQA